MTIADNDEPTVTIAATDAAAAEAGSDPGTFTHHAARAQRHDSLTVTYTVGGTASSGDYTPALTGTLTLGAGQASATIITIAPVDDALFEGDETLVLTLAADAAYTVGTPGTATATIADNDVPTVTIAATDATPLEAGSEPGTFTITRTGVTTDPFYRDLHTVGGTASSGDYTPALTGTLTLGAGQASATITIAPVDDALFEGDETLVLTLAANAAYTVGRDAGLRDGDDRGQRRADGDDCGDRRGGLRSGQRSGHVHDHARRARRPIR